MYYEQIKINKIINKLLFAFFLSFGIYVKILFEKKLSHTMYCTRLTSSYLNLKKYVIFNKYIANNLKKIHGNIFWWRWCCGLVAELWRR